MSEKECGMRSEQKCGISEIRKWAVSYLNLTKRINVLPGNPESAGSFWTHWLILNALAHPERAGSSLALGHPERSEGTHLSLKYV